MRIMHWWFKNQSTPLKYILENVPPLSDIRSKVVAYGQHNSQIFWDVAWVGSYVHWLNQFGSPSTTLYCSCPDSNANGIQSDWHLGWQLAFATGVQRWFYAFGIGQRGGGISSNISNLYDLFEFLRILGITTNHDVRCKHLHLWGSQCGWKWKTYGLPHLKHGITWHN